MNDLTLYNGDCLEFLKTLDDGVIDLVVTDPPYRVISGGNKSEDRPTGILNSNDGKIFKHNNIKISDYIPELYRVLKPDSEAYIMTNNINLRELLNVSHDTGFKLHNFLVWYKNNVTPNRWYMKNLEYTLYLYKGKAKSINNPSSKQVFEFPNPRNKIHPTEKPVELMEEYIINSSDPGMVVLDPFFGGGATGVAAVRNGRKFVGCELDLDYFNIAKERIDRELEPIFV